MVCFSQRVDGLCQRYLLGRDLPSTPEVLPVRRRPRRLGLLRKAILASGSARLGEVTPAQLAAPEPGERFRRRASSTLTYPLI